MTLDFRFLLKGEFNLFIFHTYSPKGKEIENKEIRLWAFPTDSHWILNRQGFKFINLNGVYFPEKI